MKRRLLIALALLLLLPLPPLAWLLTSEGGLQWAYRQAQPHLPGKLQINELSGSLSGPILARQVRYEQADLQVGAARLELRWDPWALFHGEIELDALEIESLALTLPPATTADDPPAGISLPEIELPLTLQLKRLTIDGVEITRGDNRFDLQQVVLVASLGRPGLRLDTARVVARDFDFELQGSLLPAASYPHDFSMSWHLLLPSGAKLGGKGTLRGNLRKTALEQRLRDALRLDLRLVLSDLLQSPRWELDADLAEFDGGGLDATLPPITGAARINASGDLEQARANGNVRIDSGAPLPLDVDFAVERIAANAGASGLVFEGLRLTTVDGEIDANGRLEWTPVIAWQAQVAARNLNPERVAPEWPANIDGVLSSNGRIDNGMPSATIEIARLGGSLRNYPVSLQGLLKLQDRDIEIDRFDFSSGRTRFTANGRVGDQLDLRWTLNSPDLAELYPEAQGQLEADGSLRGSRDAPGVSAKFNGSALALGETRIGKLHGSTRLDLLPAGTIPLDTQALKLQFDARQIELSGQSIESISVDADGRRIGVQLSSALADARVELDGSVDGLGWAGRITGFDIRNPAYGDWSLQEPAELSLAAKRVQLRSLCLRTAAQNALCASIEGAEDDWRLEADLSKIPLAWLDELIPPDLQVDGEASARARLQYRLPEQLHGEIGLQLATGTLGYRLREDRFEQIEYRGGTIDLSLDAEGISATADLGLRRDEILTASLRLPGARALNFDPQQQSLQADVRVNLVDLGIVDALLDEITGLRGRAEIRLNLGGRLGQPRPSGEASLVDVSFSLPRVQLEIANLNADAVSEGDNALKFRADATTAGGRLKLEGRSLLDAEAGWPSDLRIDAREFDLAQLLKPWIPPDITLDGRLDGNADLQIRLPDRLRGTVRLVTAGGTLAYPLPDGEPGRWALRETGLNLNLDDDGISGDTGFRIGDNSFIARFSLPQARLLALTPQTQALQGNAEIDFRDLSLLETLVPDLHQARGNLQVNLALSGTLAQPGIRGRAELLDAAVRIPRLGLDLQRIGLTATTDEGDELNFEARVASGEGDISLRGKSQLDASLGWPTEIRIEGKDFQAARIPIATVTLSPDLAVKIQDRIIDIRGDLRVPVAKLQPRDITSADKVSTDTVIIGGEKPAEKPWQITSKINLVLGERVSFFGYGFDGKLGGSLSIEEQPGQPTRGTGTINIREGRYRAYGQHLDIENGRLLFAGGPLTNPGLDIRATRTTGDVVAGVEVGGSLQKPELELFSRPAMGQTDTLSYLLTGGPLETASNEEGAMMAQAALALGLSGGDRIARSIGDRFGFEDLRVESSSSGDQASLVVGRYLSPRLYVSYGVGLIESINTLNLRYQISSKWRLETESGAEQGADLLYSIER